MDKILLVLCNSNYADEFDTQGFALFKDDVWKQHLKDVKAKIFSQDVDRDESDDCGDHVACIGTNQHISFVDFDDYKECFKTKTVSSPEEAKRLATLFGIKLNKNMDAVSSYGMFLALNPDEVEELEEDEETEDEDEDEDLDDEEDEDEE